MSDESLTGRQLTEINKAIERTLVGVISEVAARRQVVELVLKAGMEINTREHMREILEELEAFIYKPVLNLPPIEVKIL